ncbi:PDZ domain-containing protein 4-like [Syngnathus acus]|uniref:PDZ domain-containing protein 4-like n=1 Tax=Syngnathus acus TaxID=161584 RepID=UPI001885DAFA|nr:PDZ domain-containing protein 4-like [Syngnathus acus]
MGCNMCVVKRPEERYKVMYQQKGCGDSLRPMDRHGNEKVKGRRRCHLPPDRPLKSQELLQRPGPNNKSHRRRGRTFRTINNPTSTNGSSFTMVALLDNATQTDVSFPWPTTTPVLPHAVGEYDFECVFDDSDDYLEACHHDVDRPNELEYEEVELYKSHQEEKLGLTVCYKADDEDQLGIYVGEVNPNSIAAKNGRIREGDRILQINGVDIGSREEAVAILSSEDGAIFSLLLARPEMEVSREPRATTTHAPTHDTALLIKMINGLGTERESDDGEEDDDEEGNGGAPLPPLLHLTPLLSDSQDLDSGLGRTDDSTRYDESSEHDLLGGPSSACNTDAANTPASARKFCLGRSPSPRPSPKSTPSPGHARGETSPPFPHLRDLQLNSDSLTAPDGNGTLSTIELLQLCGNAWGSLLFGSQETTKLCKHLNSQLQAHKSPVNRMMAGLTEDECQRYQELLEIRYHCQRQSSNRQEEEEEKKDDTEKVWSSLMDVNSNMTMGEREMALIEEELRHLAFKWRNILRAQKMQQLRERYLQAWMMEEETAGPPDDNNSIQGDDSHHHELSAINEQPERSNDAKDSTSAYGSGESCRGTPLVSAVLIPPPREDEAPMSQWERRHSNLGCGDWDGDVVNTLPSEFRFPSRDLGSPSRRSMAEGGHAPRTGMTTSTTTRPRGGSAESSPFLAQRRQSRSKALERYHSCMALPSDGLTEPLDGEPSEDRGAGNGSGGPAGPRSVISAPCGLEDRHAASRLRLALPALAHLSLSATGQRTEWKVKIRSDGTRYVAKRPVRDRRAVQIREERGGTTTDDDAAASEMKQGRYWSKEERKQQLPRAREYRRRREFMLQSRLDYLKSGDSRDAAASSASGTAELPVRRDNMVPLSQKRMSRKRNRRILRNWNTIQELLAQGSRSPDSKKIFNPLLSFTTV